jgi:hypothetical protein
LIPLWKTKSDFSQYTPVLPLTQDEKTAQQGGFTVHFGVAKKQRPKDYFKLPKNKNPPEGGFLTIIFKIYGVTVPVAVK